MVQIIEDNSPASQKFAALSRLLQGMGNLGQSIGGAHQERQTSNTLAEKFGDEFKGIKDPQIQRMMLEGKLREQQELAKRSGEVAELKKSYPILEKRFGKEEADTIMSLPSTGAVTNYISHLLEKEGRNQGFENKYGEQEEGFEGKPNTIKLASGKEFTFPEIPEPPHRNAKELVARHEKLRTDNSKINKENSVKARGLKDTGQHLKILDSLNDKIPEGLVRLAIDKEGNIRPTALRFKAVPKEMERYVKTVNDFLTSAKDIFGSRVTNFDIQQFKSRLPGLLNSKEGRKEIVKQMQIFNQIEQNYRDALKKVYQHYGLDGIPEEEAERIAEEMTQEEESRLRSQILDIGNEEMQEEMSEGEEKRPSLRGIFG